MFSQLLYDTNLLHEQAGALALKSGAFSRD
jgi:hypothetical protein